MAYSTSDCIEQIVRTTVMRLGAGSQKVLEACSLKGSCTVGQKFGAKTRRPETKSLVGFQSCGVVAAK